VGAGSAGEGRAQLGGAARAGSWRSGAYRWVDPDSGQSLRVELCGPPELLARLADRGFERLSEDAAVQAGRVSGGWAQIEPLGGVQLEP
jgi:hypothetical protein